MLEVNEANEKKENSFLGEVFGLFIVSCCVPTKDQKGVQNQWF